MKETGIQFGADMVRAIRAGLKTQTRRIVANSTDDQKIYWNPIVVSGYAGLVNEHGRPRPSRYGSPGDRLWVKEAWADRSDIDWKTEPERAKRYVLYKADDTDGTALTHAFHGYGKGWRSSRYMPRIYTRVWLVITALRVERLQSITEADIIKEGCPAAILYGTGWYKQKWIELHGKASWEANPWVEVIDFKQVTP